MTYNPATQKRTSIVVPRNADRIYRAQNTFTGETVMSGDLGAVLKVVAKSYLDDDKGVWIVDVEQVADQPFIPAGPSSVANPLWETGMAVVIDAASDTPTFSHDPREVFERAQAELVPEWTI